MTLREIPYPVGKAPPGPFPKPERLVTTSISQPDSWVSSSLLWVAETLAASSPKNPASPSSPHILGIRGKAEETQGWRARAKQSPG